MTMTFELVIHISAGTVGLISGTIALLTQKGGANHRLAGKLYFVSMVIMALTGLHIAYLAPVYITVLAAALTFYLVATSWLTVRREEGSSGLLEIAGFMLGILVSTLGLFLSWRAHNGVVDMIGQYAVPAAIYFVFTAVAILATVTDLKLIIKKGIHGKHRILRHLWRMCVPLYIAASSFFVGQEQVFPEVLQSSPYLMIPQFAVLAAMLYWLAKVRFWGKPTSRIGESGH